MSVIDKTNQDYLEKTAFNEESFTASLEKAKKVRELFRSHGFYVGSSAKDFDTLHKTVNTFTDTPTTSALRDHAGTAFDLAKSLAGPAVAGLVTQKIHGWANKGNIEKALQNPIVSKIHELHAHLGAIGLKPADAKTLLELTEKKPSLLHKAVVLPMVGAGSIALGGIAARKISDLMNLANFDDPIASAAARAGVTRASQDDPELQSMDPKILHARGRMLYHAAPHLFQPQNREALKNTLLRLKDMGGADPSVLKDIGEYEKVMKGNRKPDDSYDTGSSIFGIK